MGIRRSVGIEDSSNLDGATALNYSHLGVYSIDLVRHPMRPSGGGRVLFSIDL
jgi:hypothetical protein